MQWTILRVLLPQARKKCTQLRRHRGQLPPNGLLVSLEHHEQFFNDRNHVALAVVVTQSTRDEVT
jgi:hypothetical protein